MTVKQLARIYGRSEQTVRQAIISGAIPNAHCIKRKGRNMYMIADASDLFERYDDEKEERLMRLPICSNCGEPIQDEKFFHCGDLLLCERCLEDCIERNDI